MNQPHDIPGNTPDSAVARRLAKLRDMPMSTAVFDAKLRAKLPKPSTASWFIWPVATPVRAMAASVLVGLAIIAAVLTMTPERVMASPQEMAAVYEHVTTPGENATVVSTIDQARAVVRQKWSKAPELPAGATSMPMSCCIHRVGEKQLACVSFMVDGAPVALAVASTKDVCSPHGTVQTVNGQRYLVSAAQGVNMIMFEHDGAWTCVMSKLPSDRLLQVAESVVRGS